VKGGRLFTGMMTLGLAGLLAGCASPNVPDYLRTAKLTRVDELRTVRYCEIFLIGGDVITRDLYGEVFNTTELNNEADPQDTCPQPLWAKIDAEALKKRYLALGVYKNGPRGWVNDWFELPISPDVRSFNGLDTRWFMKVELPKGFRPGRSAESAYKTIKAVRSSVMGFVKGQPVFILEDPSGTPWVMHAWSMTVDPKLSNADLKNLGSRLKFSPGWKYRVRVLDQDLTIKAVNGIALITQDELENTYDACFEENGENACSFKP